MLFDCGDTVAVSLLTVCAYWLFLFLLVVNLTLTSIIGEEGLLIKICLQVSLNSLFNILNDTAHGEKCHYKLIVSAIRSQAE